MIHFVGIDNGSKTHCVNIINQSGEKKIKNLTIENNPNGFKQLLGELKKLKSLYIGIESVNNPLTDFLCKNGYKVYNLNPLKINQLISASRRYFPLLDGLFSSSAPKILLKMILKYPSWEALKAVSREEMVDFLKKNHYRTPKYYEMSIWNSS